MPGDPMQVLESRAGPDKHGDVTSQGRSVGTVTKWMPEDAWGVIESPDLPGGCWVHASVVMSEQKELRAGEVVDLEWSSPGRHGYSFTAVRVVPRDDLQSTPGA